MFVDFQFVAASADTGRSWGFFHNNPAGLAVHPTHLVKQEY